MRIITVIFLFVFSTSAFSQDNMSSTQWTHEFSEIEYMSKNLSNMVPDEQFLLALRAAKLLGALDGLSPNPKNDHTKVYCALAAQALHNYINDVRSAKPKSINWATNDMKDMKENKPKCFRLLK